MTKKTITPATSQDVRAFLNKVAQTPALNKDKQAGRLIFAMDATASREPSWQQAARLQTQMFAETTKLGGLKIQLSYYRGFDEFNYSDWYSVADHLQGYMERVFCLGGHTQIERLLQHAITQTKQQKVNAMVFIGDCIEEDIDSVCNRAGALALLGVPIFIFQEGNDPVAKRAFKQIATLTRGAYSVFDSNSPQHLRDLLSAVAVFASGGAKALADFNSRQGRTVLLLPDQ